MPLLPVVTLPPGVVVWLVRPRSYCVDKVGVVTLIVVVDSVVVAVNWSIVTSTIGWPLRKSGSTQRRFLREVNVRGDSSIHFLKGINSESHRH